MRRGLVIVNVGDPRGAQPLIRSLAGGVCCHPSCRIGRFRRGLAGSAEAAHRRVKKVFKAVTRKELLSAVHESLEAEK